MFDAARCCFGVCVFLIAVCFVPLICQGVLDGFVSKTEYLEYYIGKSGSTGSSRETVRSPGIAPNELKEGSPKDSAKTPTIIFLRHEDAETCQR